MTNQQLTIGDFRSQVNVLISTLIEFCDTFNIDLFSDKYLFHPDNKKLENRRLVTVDFFGTFMPFESQLMEYQKDKYSLKSAEIIAHKTGIDMQEVKKYLENEKQNFNGSDFQNFTDDGKMNDDSQVKAISSYRIAKEIQSKQLKDTIFRNSNQNKLINL
ncbi:hypothetical protein HCG49_17990 [Arenibacter sp. 6A1]|uniref:hypothetical protein n=1 Tax=Arenibacter sp. 6A1 TaxID=2720391 RepID=UPI0014467351|nr:hypothetical protein [Arenibacter sp. 6A1]NKI28445.1 hypothetical protein [Arenibacter sp. 6A1]